MLSLSSWVNHGMLTHLMGLYEGVVLMYSFVRDTTQVKDNSQFSSVLVFGFFLQSSRASSRPSSRKSSKSKHHLNVFPPDQPLQMGSHGNSPIQRSFSEKTVPLGPNPHVLPSTGSSPYQPGLPGATFSHTYDGKIGSSYPLSATNDGRTGSSYTPSVTTSTKSSTPSHSSSTSHSSGMRYLHYVCIFTVCVNYVLLHVSSCALPSLDFLHLLPVLVDGSTSCAHWIVLLPILVDSSTSCAC